MSYLYRYKKTLLLLLISMLVAVSFIFYYAGLYHFHFEVFKQYQDTWAYWIRHHYFFAVLMFLLLYTLLAALCIPGTHILAMMGGFLFGYIAILYVLSSATLGAVIVFLVSRYLLRNLITENNGWLLKIERGFQKNAFNYMLALRLMPFSPYVIVNIVSGLLDISLATFTLTSLIGMLPSISMFVILGSGFSALTHLQQLPSIDIFLNPKIFWLFITFACISLVPVFIRSKIK